MSRSAKLRAVWDGRVGDWHDHVQRSPAFEAVRAVVLDHARPQLSDRVVDLGAGSGFLSLALAGAVDEVVAVDLSPNMMELLAQQATESGRDNVVCAVADVAAFDMPTASVDVVVSCYALHHLTDAEKTALVHRTRGWLRPGGRIVIADMMFGRGTSAHDRRILKQKVVALARKGPAGVSRIMKNVVRFGLRLGSERPVPPSFWVEALETAGFTDVRYHAVVAEAGVVVGVV